jgi:hypothetical protein
MPKLREKINVMNKYLISGLIWIALKGMNQNICKFEKNKSAFYRIFQNF